MSINFTPERWAAVSDAYSKWWNNTQTRPLISCILSGRDPGRAKPKVPFLSQRTSLDMTYSAEEIIDRVDYDLSTKEYLGDAFPYLNMACFGPGVLSAFLGAIPDNRTGKVWFHKPCDMTLDQMHFTYDPDNIWWKRIKDIYHAAVKRWPNGEAIISMVDLGGILDVLAVFRGTEDLLMDMYDCPDQVSRLVGELHELWMRYHSELCDIIEPVTPGYTDWSGIYSPVRSYILQSDFSYMISTDMFVQFVKEELRLCTEKLPNTIYHLDGKGELPHLDDILSLDKLNAVQWAPGKGAKPQIEWPEVYHKIHNAGKSIQLYDGFDCVKIISKEINSCSGIHNRELLFDITEMDYVKSKLAEFGIE